MVFISPISIVLEIFKASNRIKFIINNQYIILTLVFYGLYGRHAVTHHTMGKINPCKFDKKLRVLHELTQHYKKAVL